jgi:hypothetical protein
MITGKQIHDYYELGYSDSKTYAIYAGFQEIAGTRSHMKLGRCNNAAALQRGRAQGGANWWFVGFYPMSTNASTYIASKHIKESLAKLRVPGVQGQTELYSIKEIEIDKLIIPLMEELGYSTTNIVGKI